MATIDAALFQETGDQRRAGRTVAHGGLAYPGEVVVARRWRPEYAAPLGGDVYFRIVFLRQQQRQAVSAMALQDSRIAVCVPGRSTAGRRETVGRELHALREAGAAYLAKHDPQVESVRRSVEARARELEETLLRQEARAYAAGEVYAQPVLEAAAQEVFASASPEGWVAALGRELLARAYPSPAVHGSRLPRPLQAEDVPLLFDGLFAPEVSPAGVALLKEFGPGLGLAPLAPGALPHTVVEAGGSAVVRLAAEELEHQGDSVPGPLLLDTLAHGRGLTYSLATLALLVHMYIREPEVEVILRPAHDVLLRSGRRVPGERLSGEMVPEVQWPGDLRGQAVQVRRSAGVSWDAVLPYAAVLAPALTPAKEPQEVAEQEVRLRDALRGLRGRVQSAGESVAQLASTLGQDLGMPVRSCLDRLGQVAQASDSRDLYSRAAGLYANARSLQADVELLQRLERLALDMPEVQATVAYLRALSLLDTYQDLEMDRQIILGQVTLDGLCQSPGRWEGLRSLFDWFRSRYTTAYAQHHASFQRGAAALAEDLRRSRVKAQALERLNGIPELGEPVGTGVSGAVRGILESLPLCTLSQSELPLSRQPVCPGCGVGLGQDPPHAEVQRALAELEQALGVQTRRLASRVVQKVLSQRQEPHLERFIKAVQVSDLAGLANVPDDGLAALIREMLRQP